MSVVIRGSEVATLVARVLRTAVERDADWLRGEGMDPDAVAGLAEDLEAPLPTMAEMRVETLEAYCLALMLHHGGNVTRAAIAAEHDRKALHGFVERSGIDLNRIRPPLAKRAREYRLEAQRRKERGE